LPAGQTVHSTLTTVEEATDVAVAGAVTVTAVACDRIDDATDWATLAPETEAMLAIDVTTVAGQVTASVCTGHVGQTTCTVVIVGGGGGVRLVTTWQLRQTGGW